MDFGIFGKSGINEDIPSILLSEAFMQADSRNVFEQHGFYKALPGRNVLFQDASGETKDPPEPNESIKTPTDIFEIDAINSGTKTLTVVGNVLTGATPLADGATIRINGGTTAANNIKFTVNGTPTFSSPNSTVVVTESISAAGATEGNLFVGTTPVLKYHKYTKQSNSVEFQLAATKYHILLWNDSAKTLTVKFTSGSKNGTAADVIRWDIVTHLDKVYATNNSDYIQVWDSKDNFSDPFDSLDSATGLNVTGDGQKNVTKAKFLFSYKGYLFIAATTEDGKFLPQLTRWSTLRVPDDWNVNGDGDASFNPFDSTAAVINGFSKKDGDILIFTTGDSTVIHFGWQVTDALVFNWDEKQMKVGCLSPDAIVVDKSGRVFFLADDLTIREVDSPEIISLPVDIQMRNINTEFAALSQGTFINEFNRAYFAIPSGSSKTNNIVLDLNLSNFNIVVHEIPISAFGDYKRQTSVTYATLPYATYDDWGAAWGGKYDSNVNSVGFPLDLASDYSGNTFELHTGESDNGAAWTRTMIFGTNFQDITQFKRIHNGCELYFERMSSGSVDVYVKRDNERSWQSVGSASLADTNLPDIVRIHIPFDKRARFLELKLEATVNFQFIGIAFFEYELDGYR